MKNNRPPLPAVKPGPDLNGRKILLGVCGGIAAYKAVELTRLFIKNGARVQVVMTEAASKFVTPLTFETITGRHVFIEMFPAHGDFSPWHTEIASWPDIAVIAPATANHMARLAAGIADDLLSTIMLTFERSRVLCPSMNHRMWANPATQDNVATLKRRGFRFVMPEQGQMARPGEEDGVGRLAEIDTIYRDVHHALSAPQDLRGVRVLVTAGRTEEFWDPVRVLTNRATGRMGFALAEEAHERGADVILIHGPTDVTPPAGMRVRRITSAQEMAQVVKQEFPQSKIVLMAAAVSDYTFARTAEHKIKKGDPSPEAHLVPTEDILKSISERKGDRIVVGFALETENVLENSLRKLREKHLDIVVANNPLAPGAGFAGDTNQVLIIHRSGRVSELPLQSKREVAREILNSVINIYRHPEPEFEPEVEGGEDADPFYESDMAEPLPPPAIARPPQQPSQPVIAGEVKPTPQQPGQPALPGQPQAPREGQEPGGGRRKNRRDRHRRDRDRGPRPEGELPRQGDASATASDAPVQETVSENVAPEVAPKPEAPRYIAPPVVRPAPVVRPEPVRPAPAEVREAVTEAKPQGEAGMDSVSEGQMAELPFPNSPESQLPKKSGKSRRGGRRAQRARAARLAAERGQPEMIGGSDAPAAMDAPPPPPTLPAPVVVAPKPAPAAAEVPPPPPPIKVTVRPAPPKKDPNAPPKPRPERKPRASKAAKVAATDSSVAVETPPPPPVIAPAPVVVETPAAAIAETPASKTPKSPTKRVTAVKTTSFRPKAPRKSTKPKAG